LAAVAGCATPTLQTRPNPRPFPSSVIPSAAAGYELRAEPRAVDAFAKVGPATGVQQGAVWTVVHQGVVVGAVQLAQLKGGLSTKKDVVRAGVRGAVDNGHFRWFKVLGRQWVGVQEDIGVRRYLWLPRGRDDLYVIAQLKSDLADPLEVVEALVSAEGDLS
jgi:hypothetical protein